MIPIDLTRLPLAEMQSIVADADAAQQEINQEADADARRELIKRHRPKWAAFRPFFESLSDRKCWYTESLNPGTDDDVDHFRPKNDVAEDTTHGGYYWQALTWKNFRLSCHRANRLRTNPTTKVAHGKSDQFPLNNPAQRCRTPADDLAVERPLLLDPCNPFDPSKITFNADGTVALARRYETDQFAKQQVEVSRTCLHLDWPAFVDDRTKLYNQIAFRVSDGVEYAARAATDNGSRLAWGRVILELQGMTRPSQPYSSAARAYVSTFRNIWWVEEIVLGIGGQSVTGAM